MNGKCVAFALLLLLVQPLASGTSPHAQGVPNPRVLIQWLRQKNYAVRFVYNPPVFRPHVVTPATLRQVERNDPRYGTWSQGPPFQGVTMWISPGEMRELVEGLLHLNLAWDLSSKPMTFARERIEPPPPPPLLPWKVPAARKRETMEIDVTSDAGSAVADLPAERVCSSMAGLDGSLRAPDAVYLFRMERLDWGCKIPGFRPGDQPHSPKEAPHN